MNKYSFLLILSIFTLALFPLDAQTADLAVQPASECSFLPESCLFPSFQNPTSIPKVPMEWSEEESKANAQWSAPVVLNFNPVAERGALNLLVESSQLDQAKIKITDREGKAIHPIIPIDFSAGKFQTSIDLNIHSGVYFVNLISNRYGETRSLIVLN